MLCGGLQDTAVKKRSMKNLDKQQTAILILAAIVIAGFAGFRYVPLVRQKYALDVQVKMQKQTIEQIAASSALLPELKQQHKLMTERLEAFGRKIPEGRNFANLWQQIADMMNACRLTDQVVQPGAELTSETVCCIPLTIECKGTAEQMFAFFQSLENMDRLIRMDEVRFENDGNYSGIVKLTAKASVYYQPSAVRSG